ncbi:MAG TPA: glycosyltransferase family 9 protein [Nitrospira sp.]|nr:glycosyltransferase family 9 protein [Nitrospira sp.]
MTRQVLILNITRMGDLVQMGALLSRLHQEWPGASVDVIVDQRFASVASLLPGIRHVIAYDFHALIDETRARVKDVVAFYRDMELWTKRLVETRYDRIINLTFDRRSALLAGYIDAPDIRGVVSASDGTLVVRNPWLSYFTDCHAFRKLNRFNLVDIYALGGSGPGPAVSLSLHVPREAVEWATAFLQPELQKVRTRIAVQVGASDVMKAWRPEYFGQTLACLSRRSAVGFLLIGTTEETAAMEQAKAAYRAAGGTAPWCEALGRTTVAQLTALLTQCQLLLTNDTGPMHLAVGAGTPVVDLSVGHVNFWETGPYGKGHWVVQPELVCAPCGFDMVCPHQACKDQVLCEDVAALCLHALGTRPLPECRGGARIYESTVDEDGLGSFRLRRGRDDASTDWYGLFWRRFWYETFTNSPSLAAAPQGAPPDCEAASRTLQELLVPAVTDLLAASATLHSLCRRHPVPVREVQRLHAELQTRQQAAVAVAMTMPLLAPVTAAFLREVHNNDAEGLAQMARRHFEAYRAWEGRLRLVADRLRTAAEDGRGTAARPTSLAMR